MTSKFVIIKCAHDNLTNLTFFSGLLLIFGYDATRGSGVVSLRQSVDGGPP